MAPAIAVLTSVKYPLSNKTDFITPVCESKRIIKPLLEGSPSFGLLKKPDATFTIKDDHLLKIGQGKLNIQTAFIQGRLKIEGDTGKAMKLGGVLMKLPNMEA